MRVFTVSILLICAANVFAQTQFQEEKVWKKDPFLPPNTKARTESVLIDRPTHGDLHLSSILYSGEESSAIINGLVLRKGDEIEGQKILEIKRTYVIVEAGGKSYRLELKR